MSKTTPKAEPDSGRVEILAQFLFEEDRDAVEKKRAEFEKKKARWYGWYNKAKERLRKEVAKVAFGEPKFREAQVTIRIPIPESMKALEEELDRGYGGSRWYLEKTWDELTSHEDSQWKRVVARYRKAARTKIGG
jgi:hypothetical protein